MANPPITIGPFDNVPAPGSPIRSNWPQEITDYVVDHVVAVFAAPGIAVSSGGAASNIQALDIPGAVVKVPGLLRIDSYLRVDYTFGTDHLFALNVNGTDYCIHYVHPALMAAPGGSYMMTMASVIPVAVGAAPISIRLNAGGTANFQTFADGRVNQIMATIFANP